MRIIPTGYLKRAFKCLIFVFVFILNLLDFYKYFKIVYFVNKMLNK